VTSLVLWFKLGASTFLLFNLLFLTIISFLWWRDVSREGLIGDHRSVVQDGLKWGIRLFIFREVLFFAAWFWAFFHHTTVPSPDVGLVWPPTGVSPLDPFCVPLLNTAVLLRRGVTVTWAHHNLLIRKNVRDSLTYTVILGFLFTLLQLFEYYNTSFDLARGAYGRTFFVTTGFHGFHVVVGTIFLFVTLLRLKKYQVTEAHHVGVEFAIWYWHFVDVVWLFLFSFVYYWSF